MTDLSHLKLNLNKTITDLTEKLTSEAERLNILRKAIGISQKELEEAEGVKLRLGMLKRLVELHVQKEIELQKEIDTAKTKWDEEKQSYEEELKRTRQRNEEEYAYQQKLLKTRDSDGREEEKLQRQRLSAIEKENTDKMIAELTDLRKKTAQYPAELEKSIKEVVGKTVAETKRDAEIVQKMSEQAAQAELSLAKLKIETLEQTTKQQSSEIERLKRELNLATQQVKDVAVAVIESRKVEMIPAPKTTEDSSKK